jgi:hypothetical protein
VYWAALPSGSISFSKVDGTAFNPDIQPQPTKTITMHSTKTLALAALFVGTLASGPGHAQGVAGSGYGTLVSSGTAGNCPSYCTGGEFADQFDGGAGQVFASASEATYGTTHGSAAFAVGQSYLPELKAYATAEVGKRASTTSFASQLFGYSGSEARTVTLQVDLTGSVFNNASGYASNAIGAQIAVVRGPDIPWYPSFGTLIFEAIPASERLALGNAFINTPGVTLAQTSLVFDLLPGETFFVVTELRASSQNGVADASHTLTLNFDNAANLLAVTAVPEMGTGAMAGAGLLVLILLAKRRRQSA